MFKKNKILASIITFIIAVILNSAMQSKSINVIEYNGDIYKKNLSTCSDNEVIGYIGKVSCAEGSSVSVYMYNLYTGNIHSTCIDAEESDCLRLMKKELFAPSNILGGTFIFLLIFLLIRQVRIKFYPLVENNKQKKVKYLAFVLVCSVALYLMIQAFFLVWGR
jgi:hypothetical protein